MGLAESGIKRVAMIAPPLLMQSKLPSSAWGYAILHAGNLLKYRPSSNNEYSPLQFLYKSLPVVSHIRIFGSAVYVPIPPPKRTKMGPQRRLGINIGFVSPSIIRYIEPAMRQVFTGRFADCVFDEVTFPTLGSERNDKPMVWDQFRRPTGTITWDRPTPYRDLEVQRILKLNEVVTFAPDAFVDTAKALRSKDACDNAPIRLDTTTVTPAHNVPPQRKWG